MARPVAAPKARRGRSRAIHADRLGVHGREILLVAVLVRNVVAGLLVELVDGAGEVAPAELLAHLLAEEQLRVGGGALERERRLGLGLGQRELAPVGAHLVGGRRVEHEGHDLPDAVRVGERALIRRPQHLLQRVAGLERAAIVAVQLDDHGRRPVRHRVGDELDHLALRRSWHGHHAACKGAYRVGKLGLPEVKPLLRRAEEFCPLLLHRDRRVIYGGMVKANDCGRCTSLYLRAASSRHRRRRRNGWLQRAARPPLHLLARVREDWRRHILGRLGAASCSTI
mmetsp:Transcript_94160/g.282294  ORF Transcript_94160/g.282294 Transcript_94160/m.282294 type:complete len:284 (-) Transcript_94160:136-987(-)